MTRAGTAGFLAVALASTIVLGTAQVPAARAACTADITSQDPGCPAGTGPCTISQNKTFQIDDGCILDFSSRTVTINGTLDINSGNVTLKAGTLTVSSTGLIDGRGTQSTPPGNRGGMITIQATGAVTVQKGIGTKGINVSANETAGVISIVAGGTVTVAGSLVASQLLTSTVADGGSISIQSDGDIVSQVGSIISATGGSQAAAGGGEVDLTAGGQINLGDKIDVSGSQGGALNLCSGGVAVTRKLSANGTGDAGGGGTVNITAGTGVQVLDQILAEGNISTMMAGGGPGGVVTIAAQFGDLMITGDISAAGALPDGVGGEVDLMSQGNTAVQSSASVSAKSNGAQGCGGFLCILANLQFINGGMLDASGGLAGGEIDAYAGTDMMLGGSGVDISGRGAGGFGGTANFAAASNGQGGLTISSKLDVTGGACSQLAGCGVGGATALGACNLTVTAAGSVLAGAPIGGRNDLTANEQLTILGKVNAAKMLSPGNPVMDGDNVLEYPSRNPPSLAGAAILPTPVATPWDTCSPTVLSNCLVPCPTCGNGQVEFPETCDNGTARGCNGCSAFCQLENCDDGLVCTTDSCDPLLGCQHLQLPTAVCTEPPTLTPTRTSTPTPTATRTATASPTLTPTLTATASDTPTSTATTTRTPSPTATPTQTSSPTGTPTPTPSVTPTASVTATPMVRGDANCDGRVTAADLPELVMLTTSGLGPGCGDSLDFAVTISAIFNQPSAATSVGWRSRSP
jgi:cysteine-rich repeat protein